MKPNQEFYLEISVQFLTNQTDFFKINRMFVVAEKDKLNCNQFCLSLHTVFALVIVLQKVMVTTRYLRKRLRAC